MEALQQLALENRDRLVHLEQKLDDVLRLASKNTFAGHPDQFFGGRTFAQHGDDLVLACIFHRLGIAQPSYLDIGAHHPYIISNTALFYSRGCRGINVEANPFLIKAFEENRPEDINLNLGVGPEEGILDFYMIDEFSGRNTFNKAVAEAFVRDHPEFSISRVMQVNVVTINKIIDAFTNSVFPDLLSLDVEGVDESILATADFSKSKPKVICVEIENASGSLAASSIYQLLTNRGYTFVFRAISNAIFVDSALWDTMP